MSPSIPAVQTVVLATNARTKSEIRTLSDHETKVVAAGTAVISSADLHGAQPDASMGRGIRADRIYRK
jgi:hypothetical protein